MLQKKTPCLYIPKEISTRNSIHPNISFKIEVQEGVLKDSLCACKYPVASSPASRFLAARSSCYSPSVSRCVAVLLADDLVSASNPDKNYYCL